MLIQLRSVGPASAAIFAREIFGRHFANRRQVASYLGLTPSAYDSGSTTRCQGISKAGNGFARRFMTEVAWLWRKHQADSALAKWYEDRAAAAYPSHHVGRSGTQTHRRSLALCRNRSRP
jgi:transposase